MPTLEEFATALKAERRRARRTLRELAEASSRSISYLSDVEQGRKLPPAPEVVAKIEQELGIKDGRLTQLAQQVRNLRPSELVKMLTHSIPAKTRFVGDLMRADGLTEEDMEELHQSLREIEKRRHPCQG